MPTNPQILLRLVFKSNKDYNNFNTIISENLKEFSLPLRKKIIICSVELIQNNIIHNPNPDLIFEIKKDESHITIEAIQKITQRQAVEIQKIINEINSKDFNSLKEIQLSNIITDSSYSKKHGNGFIICKLKSENNIEINKKDKELSIKLKFKI